MKILLTEPLIEEVDKEGLEILANLGNVEVAPDTREQTLQQVIREADILVTRLAKVSANVIESASKLKIIGRTGVGVDNIDVEAATRRCIYVLNVPALNADSVAEHTFGLILSLSRCILRFDSEVRRGNWRSKNQLTSINNELHGKTLGIVGLGAIGQKVAKLGNAFGMKNLAYDPYVSTHIFEKVHAESVEMNRLLSESDIITIHTASTKETYHMISSDAFQLMKKTALLINCSRGGVVDEKALRKALEERRIAGAGLDVLESEPPPSESPLFKLDNVIITPHVAGLTKEARSKTLVVLAQDIARAATGQTPVNLVNKEDLQKARKKGK
jgi:D-3-phosphoglycerate dehydrogenase